MPLEPPLQTFRSRAEEAQSRVHLVRGWAEVAALASELAAGQPVAIAASLAREVPLLVDLLGGLARIPDVDAPAVSVADSAVGIVRGVLGVAETGSVLMVEPELTDRCVSMLSHAVIQVVDRERVVDSLAVVAEVLQAMGPPAYASLTTGPSRTADIERSLTIGVQGPREVHVAILG